MARRTSPTSRAGFRTGKVPVARMTHQFVAAARFEPMCRSAFPPPDRVGKSLHNR
jgi:hypothetical protein